MSRKLSLALLFVLLCSPLLIPQEWKRADDTRWTDKNNTEQYARYLIHAAYADHGYIGAKVEIQQSGTKRLFIVDPGEIFHVKEIVFSGLENFPKDKLLENAPKPGDVYSAERENEWVAQIRKQYGRENGTLTLVKWGAAYDHDHALVTVHLDVRER